MRATLFPFQEMALADLHEKIHKAHTMWSEKDPQVISFSAPTGAGKTIIMTALFGYCQVKFAISRYSTHELGCLGQQGTNGCLAEIGS